MKFYRRLFPFLLLLFAVVACAPQRSELPPTAAALEFVLRQDDPPAVATPTPEPESAITTVGPPDNEQLSLITLPVSVYIVDGEDESAYSVRDEAEVQKIFERVNDIWAQAGIQITVRTVTRITIPEPVFGSIQGGNFTSFFEEVGVTFDVPNHSLINAFYTQQMGGPNGIVPFSSRVFFVSDTPSVLDERVTAHEIGHILGLHHVLDDPDCLMYSGTNGMKLTDPERFVVRYTAEGILNRVR